MQITEYDSASAVTQCWSVEALATAAQRALVNEVELWPKPGLVDPLGNSTHPDMSLESFLQSAVALGPWLRDFVRVGIQSRHTPVAEVLPQLRPLGLRAEAAMFRATGGVNTHRGAIFIFGIVLAACGRLGAPLVGGTGRVLRETAAIADGIVARELSTTPEALPNSHGGNAFQLFGFAGVRGEAERGFPTVFDAGLPALLAARARGASERAARLDALMALAATTDDTTTVHRGGLSALRGIQLRAAQVRERGGVSTVEGRQELRRLCRWATERQLSLGGCADLLALTLFLADLAG